MNLRLLFTSKMLYYFRLKQRKTVMKKITTLILLSFLASISFSNATEFNENSLYSNQVESAYNQVDLPLLPGSWKIYDLEKSGSVASGNFYVYATLVPSDVDEDVRRYNDIITYALLGSKSEETSYRKTFFGCEGGFNAQEGSIVNINTRGSGNFEETCAVDQPDFGNMNFFYTDCSNVCVEVGINLEREKYKNDRKSFEAMTTQIFETIRKTVGGQSVSMDFMSSYEN